MRTSIYRYYENNQLICTGTIQEIAAHLHYSKSNVYRIKYNPTNKKKLVFDHTERPLYEVLDKTGKVLFTGDAWQCADYMQFDYRCFHEAVYDTALGKRTGRFGALLARRIS